MYYVLLSICLCLQRQPDILCGGWSGRLEQSPTGHSFGTYIINFQNMLKTLLFSRSYFTD